MRIQTVLCPIDFSTLSDYELELAVEVCRTFDARLVLHHNLEAAGPGFAKAWEWEGAHQAEELPEDVAREKMGETLARIPEGIQVEARISRGPVGLVLLYLIDEIEADLVILGSHGWSSEEHSSLSERVIESAPCPVLTFQEGRGEGHAFRLRKAEGEEPPAVLVPTDFSEAAGAAVAHAFELARKAPVALHLLHVESTRKPQMVPVDHTGETVERLEGAVEVAKERLGKLVPADLAGRVDRHVTVGAVGDEIMAAVERLDAELIVMGEHAPGFFRHYFTHDTAREMLHRARCPVWYVPPPGRGK